MEGFCNCRSIQSPDPFDDKNPMVGGNLQARHKKLSFLLSFSSVHTTKRNPQCSEVFSYLYAHCDMIQENVLGTSSILSDGDDGDDDDAEEKKSQEGSVKGEILICFKICLINDIRQKYYSLKNMVSDFFDF